MRSRPISFALCCLMCLVPALHSDQETASADYSKEAFVIEKLATHLTFTADGTGTQEITATVRVQSEAGVRNFGVIGSSYKAETERFEIAYVRVRKPDGRVIDTPIEGIQDLPNEVTREAPMYSDIREKQLPVKGLGAGDVVEYQFRWIGLKPEIPGEFWYTHEFIRGPVALEETLEIRVPAGKYTKIDSPQLQPQIREEGNEKIYFWKTAQLRPTGSDPKNTVGQKMAKDQKPADMTARVQLTTFHDWDEVGRWYERLQSDRVTITPAIRAKAAELTSSLQNDLDKERAIYNYVSTKFRYISISFGDGRYQPHAADEVLSNQYSDCKDKHTLFAALLKAAGIEAWPALIGAGIKFDSTIPSPAQFNHVITVLPHENTYLWLDTTPEVAPFGLLNPSLRGEQALVIPNGRPALLLATPQDPIFRTSDLIEAKAALDGNGTLTAHFDVTVHGDLELLLRTGFHQSAPAGWRDLVQALVQAWGFAGEVGNVSADNPESLDKPFHFSYDYKRENYSDWANRRIGPPFPGFDVAAPDAEKPIDPVSIGSVGESIYRATLQLPKDNSAEIPANTEVHTDFGDYSATYSVTNGVLSVERRFVIKKSKPPLTAWKDYLAFSKQVRDDESQLIQLANSEGSPSVTVVQNNPEAAALIQQAIQAVQNREMNAAADALAQAERLNPKQAGLWASYGFMYLMEHKTEKCIESYQKEIQIHPENTAVYESLAQLQARAGRIDDAIETMHLLANRDPGDTDTVLKYTALLMQTKHYEKILPALEKPLAVAPNDFQLQAVRAEALLYTNRKDEGVAAARKIAESNANSGILNNLAYMLVETKSDLALARQMAEKAVTDIEVSSKDLKLADLTEIDLQGVNGLAASWDTLGWAYCEQGDIANAERYLAAAWKLSQDGVVGDHLGQLYERQGKHQAAIHMWQLALAANGRLDETRERLRAAGAFQYSKQTVQTGKKTSVTTFTAQGGDFQEELGKLRMAGVPSLPKQTGSAEFFLLFSPLQVEEVQFIGGQDRLKNAGPALRQAHYDLPFPDRGPEKIARRGILSCSELTTPSCEIVLLLPANTRK